MCHDASVRNDNMYRLSAIIIHRCSENRFVSRDCFLRHNTAHRPRTIKTRANSGSRYEVHISFRFAELVPRWIDRRASNEATRKPCTKCRRINTGGGRTWKKTIWRRQTKSVKAAFVSSCNLMRILSVRTSMPCRIEQLRQSVSPYSHGRCSSCLF